MYNIYTILSQNYYFVILFIININIQSMTCKNTALIAITNNGINISKKLKNTIKYDLYLSKRFYNKYDAYYFDKIGDVIEDIFNKYDCVIFVLSLGAVIRLISPYLKSKYIDPKIIAIDDANKFTISVISGHEGANDLCRYISSLLNNIPVITTASDVDNKISPEYLAYKYNLKIINKNILTKISSDIINDNNICIKDETNLNINYNNKNCDNYIMITYKKNDENKYLIMVPKILVIGIGFSTDADFNGMKNAIINLFNKNNFYTESIKTIATIDIKNNNEHIKKLSGYFNADLIFYNKDELNKNSIYKSNIVYKYTGAYSVSNAAGRIASNNGKELIGKEIFNNITISVFEYEYK